MEIKKTITTIFMVPTLKITSGRLTSNGFINGYCKDSHRDIQYENAVYLLFQPKDLDRFRSFLDIEYERTKSVIEDYDYEDGYVVVVYKLDPEYQKDFDMIRQGKYSLTSKAFQSLFPQKMTQKRSGLRKEQWTLQFMVFNRRQEMITYWENKLGMRLDKNQELWHMFSEEEETLDLNKIKQHV